MPKSDKSDTPQRGRARARKSKAKTKAKARRGKPAKDWQAAFLTALGKSGNVAVSCKKAKVNRDTAYAHRNRSAPFRAEWDEALETAIDGWEDEARRRAVTGCLKPVFQGGVQVGKVREFSDTLLMFLLRGKRPEIYAGLNEKKLAELLTEKFAPYVVSAHVVTPVSSPAPAAITGPVASNPRGEPPPAAPAAD
ncbi:MAG TPA: hypothetical protein PLB88_10830 [Thermoanaerobaculaceae bacterium]|nr:hypothetical protein [Thermoanaerobaculaceae bacterium]